MASVDLRAEAKQIVDGLPDRTLLVAVGLLTALKDQRPFRRDDLLTVYPWARHLSDAERDEFLDELTDATKRAEKNGDWLIADEIIDAWRETAEILADTETMVNMNVADQEIEKGEVASWDAVKQRLHIKL